MARRIKRATGLSAAEIGIGASKRQENARAHVSADVSGLRSADRIQSGRATHAAAGYARRCEGRPSLRLSIRWIGWDDPLPEMFKGGQHIDHRLQFLGALQHGRDIV